MLNDDLPTQCHRTPRPFSRLSIALTAFSVASAVLLLAPGAYAGGYTYTTLFGPTGAIVTEAFGIDNNGDVVGEYINGSGGHYGFLYSQGTYTTLYGPSNTGATDPFTEATGISNSGEIVGSYGDFLTGKAYGYTYIGGTYTSFSEPSSTFPYTLPEGVNSSGAIVGTYQNNSFLYSGGTYTTLSATGASSTFAVGINDAGTIVGSEVTGTGTYGFVDNGGTYTTLNDPNSVGGGSNGTGAETSASGINSSGVIVGTYQDASSNANGFFFSGGSYTTFDEPNEASGSRYSQGTSLSGINDSGEIAGTYSTSSTSYGFIAIPISGSSGAPEPGAGILSLLGLVSTSGIVAARRICFRQSATR
jgi:hypothetical protein